jgi:N-acetylornithine carbamoyltransferase
LAITWTHSTSPASAAVVHSLLLAALRAGVEVRLAHPAGYELDEQVLAEAARTAESRGVAFATGLGAREAAQGAHVVYARSWQSLEDYGNPTLAASRRARNPGWRVDEALMSLTENGKFMHAMPVRRNVEVSDEVLDGPRSLVVQQAENRLHSQKALLLALLGGPT